MKERINYKSILQMIKKSIWFLLICFTFSSCSIKEAVFESFGVALEMPNGQSKTVTTCQTNFIVSDKKETSEIVSEKQALDADLSFKSNFFSTSNLNTNEVSIVNNSNSPPKYILYQRLKIAIA